MAGAWPNTLRGDLRARLNQQETHSVCEKTASSPLSERRWKMEERRGEEEREGIFQTNPKNFSCPILSLAACHGRVEKR